MASAIIKKTCAKCNKGGGTAICYGCEHAFCTKHFIEHRQELSKQVSNIGQEHDLIQRDLAHEHSTHPLLARIDDWEQESIVQILVAAETARTDLRQLLDSAKNDLKTSVSKITTELQSSRESDDYTEIDITKWMEQLKEVRKMLDNLSNYNIDCDNDTRPAIHLIKVHDQQASNISSRTLRTDQEIDCISTKQFSLSPERFVDIFGEVRLLGDGLEAVCTDGLWGRPCVGGIGRYSSGTHTIRFRIEQMIADYCFFYGIVTSSQKLTNDIYNSSSAHGWWDLERTIVNGTICKQKSTKIIRTGDQVTILLDCDNRRIQLEHHRTNRVDHIPIDLRHCPFPWKMAILLLNKGDRVRILH